MELAPAEVQTRIVRFGIRRALGEAASPAQEPNEALSLESGRRGEAKEVGDRGQHVHERNGLGPPCPRPLTIRQSENERDPERRVIEEKTVSGLLVLAKTLAVVAREHDQHGLLPLVALDPLDEPSDLSVGERDFSVVWPLREFLAIRGRRLIGIVRVVEVRPQEERSFWPALEPGERSIGDLVSRALDVSDRGDSGLMRVEAVDVLGEAAVQSPPGIEDERRDDRRCSIAASGEQRRERRQRGRNEETSVVPHSMMQRVGPREKRRVRRQRQRSRRNAGFEEHAFAGEPVHVRSARARVSIRAEPVRAERVDGDEEHVPGARSALTPDAAPEQHEGGHNRDSQREAERKQPRTDQAASPGRTRRTTRAGRPFPQAKETGRRIGRVTGRVSQVLAGLISVSRAGAESDPRLSALSSPPWAKRPSGISPCRLRRLPLPFRRPSGRDVPRGNPAAASRSREHSHAA